MNDFKLIPIYDAQALNNELPIIYEGIQKVFEHALDGENFTAFKNDLLGQKLLLWEASIDGEYAGFVTCKLLLVGLDYKELYISQCYVKEGAPHDLLIRGMPILEEHAKRLGCSRMVFRTLRSKPFLRKLGEHGWREGYVELYKLIEGVK